jgi:hypothetical protein
MTLTVPVVSSRPGCHRWFWAWTQHALDRAAVHAHAKLRPDPFRQLAREDHRLVDTRLPQRIDDLWAELVPPPWPWSLPRQRGQPTTRKRRLCRIEGWSRKAEAGRGVGDRLPFSLDAPHHLVFDLDQVTGIEERMADESGIRNRGGVRIESTGGAQRLALGVTRITRSSQNSTS